MTGCMNVEDMHLDLPHIKSIAETYLKDTNNRVELVTVAQDYLDSVHTTATSLGQDAQTNFETMFNIPRHNTWEATLYKGELAVKV
jgi:hypothetical protein